MVFPFVRVRERRKRERERLTNICLAVVGLSCGSHDVHTMAPSVVQFLEQHKGEHLQNCTNMAKAINSSQVHHCYHATCTKERKNKRRAGASRTERKKRGRERKKKKTGQLTKPKQQFKSENGSRKKNKESSARADSASPVLYSKQPNTTRNNRPLEPPFPCTSLTCSGRGSLTHLFFKKKRTAN
jgi:hypothetical protein